MTDLVLGARPYRVLDVTTKLGGVALLAGALELGIVSTPGATLALAGGVLGVSTVFVTEEQS